MANIKNYKILVGINADDDINKENKKYRFKRILSSINQLITNTNTSISDNSNNNDRLTLLENKITNVIETLNNEKTVLINTYNEHKAVYDVLVKLAANEQLTENEITLLTTTFNVSSSTINQGFGIANKQSYEDYLNNLQSITNDQGIDLPYVAQSIVDDIATLNNLLSQYNLSSSIQENQTNLSSLLNELNEAKNEVQTLIDNFDENEDYESQEYIYSQKVDMWSNNTLPNYNSLINDDRNTITRCNTIVNEIRKTYPIPSTPGTIIPPQTYKYYIGGAEPTLNNDDWKNNTAFSGCVNYREVTLNGYPTSDIEITVPNYELNETPSYVYVLVANDKNVTFIDKTSQGTLTRVETYPLDDNNKYYLLFDEGYDDHGVYGRLPWDNGAQILIRII